MRVRIVLLAAAMLAAPLAAEAQPIQGLYVGAGAGYNLPQNIRVTPLSGDLAGSHLRLEENGGVDLTGSVGYALGDGWRFEVEGDWIRNGISKLVRTPLPTTASGNVRTYGVMANALYDFDIKSPYVFPYLGAGLGYMWTSLHNTSFVSPGGFSFSSDSNEGRFAWQLIAGLSFPVPNTPGLSLLTQYRFLDVTGGGKFTGTTSASAGGGASLGDVKLGQQLSHTFLVGVRYAFNVTPPPAPPAPGPIAAPAPAPARSYLVFFDWDKATLSERARQIVAEAAANSRRVQYTRIEVNGYTDTSGSPRYNMGLSIRRARAVAAELVRDGVPRSAIAIRGFGQTHLLVPTGPGVREPQNRRVEIIIR
jgi:OOP family OmpA-OmpF porin